MIPVLNTRTRDPQVNLPKVHKCKTKDIDTKEHALKLCTSGLHEYLYVDGVDTSHSMSTVESSAFLAKLILPVHGVDQRYLNHSWIYHLPSFALSSNHWLWFQFLHINPILYYGSKCSQGLLQSSILIHISQWMSKMCKQNKAENGESTVLRIQL